MIHFQWTLHHSLQNPNLPKYNLWNPKAGWVLNDRFKILLFLCSVSSFYEEH